MPVSVVPTLAHRHRHADEHAQQPPGQVGRQQRQRLRAQAREALAQQLDAQEQHAEARYRLPQRAAPRGAAREVQGHAQADEGQGEGVHLHREAQPRHQPARDRRAQVGAEHHPQRRREAQQPRVDEADGRHRHRRGRLHQRRERHARGQAVQGRARPGCEHALQRLARRQLEPAGEHGHAQQEQADAAQQRAGGDEGSGGDQCFLFDSWLRLP
jgi:hypothetical protein